ncbi:helix-turn-helix domain-containing protein [Spirillospora sp. NBC_00431]
MKTKVAVFVSGPSQEMYIVTCASAVFGYHGPEIPRLYEFKVFAERPGPIRTSVGADLMVVHGLEVIDDADTVIIASWLCAGAGIPAGIVGKLTEAHARGARLVAICGGIWILAATGLLDGREAAVHWELAADLARRHPRIKADATILYSDHGDVATAGASAPTIDLCLNQVRRERGAALALRIGRQFSVAPFREGDQRQFRAPPTNGPVPGTLSPLLDWLIEHLDEPLTLEDMAARAGMSPRSLSRHFSEQLGTSPGRWLLNRRIATTRALLEETDLPVETIAQRVGLSSAVNLRRRFHAALNTTPARYRTLYRRQTPAPNTEPPQP